MARGETIVGGTDWLAMRTGNREVEIAAIIAAEKRNAGGVTERAIENRHGHRKSQRKASV